MTSPMPIPQPTVAARAAKCGRSIPLLLGCLLSGAAPLQAENTNHVYRPALAVPGGVDPRPVITAAQKTATGFHVQWSGLQGPFQLQGAEAVPTTAWQDLGGPTFSQSVDLSPTGPMGFLRVLAGEPQYVGSTICKLCHRDTHSAWGGTAHANAIRTLANIGQQNNAQCLPCHTVGYGWESGFQNVSATPKLADVQCENCHGPGVPHVENVDDPVLRPAVTPAAEICGGCHNGFHHPTFDEWKTSAHARVDPEVAESMEAQGEARMKACGPCHSGAVRLALLRQMSSPQSPLPSREDAAHFPVTCAVCHDPHAEMANPAQLRNPVYSTNHFSYSTSASTSFAQQYNPNVQICGQCHNQRGARAEDTARPPHHSPQYNIVVGTGGYDGGTSLMATHGHIEQQCARCHTHPHEPDPVTPSNPNYTGHTFEVRYEGCTSSDPTISCHSSADLAERYAAAVGRTMKSRIAEVKALLDQWATTQAPAALRDKYGALAWEYSTPGSLSNPDGLPGVQGPTADEQRQVPLSIKQARMNLYLVEYDQSFGVHNGKYTRHLLGLAKTNVVTELKR